MTCNLGFPNQDPKRTIHPANPLEKMEQLQREIEAQPVDGRPDIVYLKNGTTLRTLGLQCNGYWTRNGHVHLEESCTNCLYNGK